MRQSKARQDKRRHPSSLYSTHDYTELDKSSQVKSSQNNMIRFHAMRFKTKQDDTKQGMTWHGRARNCKAGMTTYHSIISPHIVRAMVHVVQANSDTSHMLILMLMLMSMTSHFHTQARDTLLSSTSISYYFQLTHTCQGLQLWYRGSHSHARQSLILYSCH